MDAMPAESPGPLSGPPKVSRGRPAFPVPAAQPRGKKKGDAFLDAGETSCVPFSFSLRSRRARRAGQTVATSLVSASLCGSFTREELSQIIKTNAKVSNNIRDLVGLSK